jgi:hypothetical protein
MSDYLKFIKTKQLTVKSKGIEIDFSELNDKMFQFQKFSVKWSLLKAKSALFEDCGLGKTVQEMEWGRMVIDRTGQSVIILCPLAVAPQFLQEGEKFGIPISKWQPDNPNGILEVVNYDKLHKIDPSKYSGVILDESGILKNFEGKIKNSILEAFKDTPYKLAATATPAPNDPMELGNHAEFLDIMTRNQMLSMFFVHDSGNTQKWRLKKHAVDEFYKWVGQWAIMMNKPSDIGFHVEGYDLPEINYIERQLPTSKRNNGMLFNEVAVSATDFNKELRLTQEERMKEAAKIANSSNENFIIWIKHNKEGEILRKLIPDSVEVKGSDKPEVKENMLLGFANNKFRVLITKTKIAQFGLNYQNCHNQIFASLDFSFEGLYQAIRRSYRFGQKHQVNIFIITADTMQNVSHSIKRKQKDFQIMQDKMAKNVNVSLKTNEEIPAPDYKEEVNEHYRWILGDSFELVPKLFKDNSMDTMFFSPSFESLYVYSNNPRDLSNVKSSKEFTEHFSFLVPELFRMLKPGRHVGMHLTQLTTQKGKDGYYSIRDFRGDMIRLFQSFGFIFHAEVTIWKDPELAAIRTKNHQLLHKTTKRDSADNRPGLADYLVVMRKPGINEEPINHEGNGIPFDLWTKIASPVWMDIKESDVFSFREGRENEDERHITPTQRTVVKRYLMLYSNPGDTCFTPFGGIGTDTAESILNGRYGVGIELKESYWKLGKITNDKAVSHKEMYKLDL